MLNQVTVFNTGGVFLMILLVCVVTAEELSCSVRWWRNCVQHYQLPSNSTIERPHCQRLQRSIAVYSETTNSKYHNSAQWSSAAAAAEVQLAYDAAIISCDSVYEKPFLNAK